jgi:DNA-binding protein H-NS
VNNDGLSCLSFTFESFMSKTLAQIQSQIAKLQKEAAAIKSKEVAAIAAKIRALMSEHGLSVDDLGLSNVGTAAPKKTAKAARKIPKAKPVANAVKGSKAPQVTKATKPAKAGKSGAPVAPAKPASKAAKKSQAGKAFGVIKFRDEAGNAWTGRGKRPQWYLNALASGKSPEQLLVKSAG